MFFFRKDREGVINFVLGEVFVRFRVRKGQQSYQLGVIRLAGVLICSDLVLLGFKVVLEKYSRYFFFFCFQLENWVLVVVFSVVFYVQGVVIRRVYRGYCIFLYFFLGLFQLEVLLEIWMFGMLQLEGILSFMFLLNKFLNYKITGLNQMIVKDFLVLLFQIVVKVFFFIGDEVEGFIFRRVGLIRLKFYLGRERFFFVFFLSLRFNIVLVNIYLRISFVFY